MQIKTLGLLKGYYFGCAPKYIPDESRQNEGKISKGLKKKKHVVDQVSEVKTSSFPHVIRDYNLNCLCLSRD